MHRSSAMNRAQRRELVTGILLFGALAVLLARADGTPAAPPTVARLVEIACVLATVGLVHLWRRRTGRLPPPLPPGPARTAARALDVASVAIVVGVVLPLFAVELGARLDRRYRWSALALAAVVAWIAAILRARATPDR